ncbi:MAG: alpha/beta hydrolase, partial [Clostridia bacterium]|nr:alpha/beta hydrolase [Clostridia bacterium]
MFDFFRKPKLKDGITEREFACKRDGLTIRGSEYRPDGEKLPIAIVCHGFMAWQDTVRHYAVMLAEMGYAAYCFDFNGGSVMRSKSDGRTTEMSVLTEIKDLEAVIAHV